MELWTPVTAVWVLTTNRGSSARLTSALNLWAISTAPNTIFPYPLCANFLLLSAEILGWPPGCHLPHQPLAGPTYLSLRWFSLQPCTPFCAPHNASVQFSRLHIFQWTCPVNLCSCFTVWRKYSWADLHQVKRAALNQKHSRPLGNAH